MDIIRCHRGPFAIIDIDKLLIAFKKESHIRCQKVVLRSQTIVFLPNFILYTLIIYVPSKPHLNRKNIGF